MTMPGDVMAKFDVCRVCGKELDADTKAWARQRFEQKTCSPECFRKNTIRQWACCEEAEIMPCVCMYSFTCKKHGQTHVGTHD